MDDTASDKKWIEGASYLSNPMLNQIYINFCLYHCAGATDNVTENIGWLKIFHEPQEKLVQLWSNTTKARLEYIHGSTAPSVSDIFKEWPRYADEKGYILVRK